MRNKETYERYMDVYYIESDCGCNPEFAIKKVRKARKERNCVSCGGKINKGELYFNESGKFDGEFFDIGTCQRCMDSYIDDVGD